MLSGSTATWENVSLRWDSGDSVSLRVTQPAPNSVPTAADGTVTTDEDTAYPFTAGNFSFTDTDTADRLVSVTIVTVPLAGTLALSGMAVTAGDSVAKTAVDGGSLTFTPAADANGTGYTSFTFKVSDGTDVSADAYTITINVTPVNDPAAGEPTISGTAQVGHTLTADPSGITDVDGVPGTLTYQWIRVDGADAEITNATSITYALAAGDAGKKIKVKVDFTDDDGTDETLTSPAFPATGTVVGSAVVVTDAADLGTTEAGGVDTFQVALATQPLAQVVVGLTSSDTGEGMVSPAALTFTDSNWSTAQTVTATGVDDSDLDGDEEYSITFAVTSTDTHYNGLSVNPVTVTNTNDDMVLNVDMMIAGDDVVNIEEKAAGFPITGDTGSEPGVAVTVKLGSGTLTATASAGGAWSVAVPAAASYLTESSVVLTVSASKAGFTAPGDVERTVMVDLTAPTVSYTPPASLKVGSLLAATDSTTSDLGIVSYAATGLPAGLEIDATTGAISGTPTAADAASTVTVTVTDGAGNAGQASIALPEVEKGDQTLSGFAYSIATVTFGDPSPTVTPPTGAMTAVSYSASPGTVCTVNANTGALTIAGAGTCEITVTAEGAVDYNAAGDTFTVTVQAEGTLSLSLAPVAGDDVVNIAEHTVGFGLSGSTGSEVSVTVKVGSQTLGTVMSTAGGGWAVPVVAGAAYLTEPSVVLTVSATKAGSTAPADVVRTVTVDLTAPSAPYTAPASLKVGETIAAFGPTSPSGDIDSYEATGLPAGLEINETTGAISGTPTTAGAAATATATVTDSAGNATPVSITFPAVAKADQTLTGFAYSADSVAAGGTAPTVTAPNGAMTAVSYSASLATVCTVNAGTGALTLVGAGACMITATATGNANYNAATVTFTVNIAASGALVLTVGTVADDDVVNIKERTDGFRVRGGTGTEPDVAVTVKLGSGTLTATTDSNGTWSVPVPAQAAYITGTSVGLTVSATKSGATSPADVTRMIVVDLAAPSVSYTAPASLEVDVAASVSPTTSDTDLKSYAATGLPAGLTIDTGMGVISGTPTAGGAGGTATVTVTDNAGNPIEVSVAFPEVEKGGQSLMGFRYSADVAVFNQTPPTVTAPTGAKTPLSYSAAPPEVCTVDAGSGALSFTGSGNCLITVTAAGTANYDAATAMFTVMVESAGVLALNLDAVAGDNVVNIAEKAMGFLVTGDAGSQSAATVTVKLGSGTLTATSGAGGSWSAEVPPNASYVTGTSVVLTVSATKAGLTAATDVSKTVTVDLTAPSATYTAPGSLKVGAAITAIQPAGASSDVMSYAAEGLPMGLTIGTGAGEISGTPTAAASATATATVTVTDTAGNAAPVTITFPAVAKGDQTLTGFAYSGGTVVFGNPPPTVTAPSGAKTPLSYSAAPPAVCTVDAGSGALSFTGSGNCLITVTAADTANYDAATAMFTVMVASAGMLVLNLDAVATDNVVNIAEKAMGFLVTGDAGSQSAATVTVKLGSGTLTATSGAGGSWSAEVPPNASYVTGTSVVLTVSATKAGFTAATDVSKTVTVDLTAPSATYTAPGSLQVGAAITAIQPAGASSDVMSYAAEGLPMGLTIDTAGEISGTPTAAASATATATVTVMDGAGNAAPVTITFPAVAKGDQTLTGFAYSGGTVVFGNPPPTVTAPSGAKTPLSYSAAPPAVCAVNAGSGALSLLDLGECTITVTAAVSADYNEATATATVTVQSAGVLALNVSAVAGDNVVNIAEKAVGFTISGNTGSQDGVTVTVMLGTSELPRATSDTSASPRPWSVAVPANASYVTGTSVVLTVSATKAGFTAAADVAKTVTVDLTAPSATYTAPGSLQVGAAITAIQPAGASSDVMSYAAEGLPMGLTIDTAGEISGTPTAAASATATATVTVMDTAGNAAPVTITFPAVAKGDQILTGFAYSGGTVVFGNPPPTVTAPSGAKTPLSYSAAPPAVCAVNAGSGALSLLDLGECTITVTAAVSADYNEATATATVTVQSAGVLALNVSAVAGDNVVNIAEKAVGFTISGNTGSQDGVTVTVMLGTSELPRATSDTSASPRPWSVAVPANASYVTGTSVVLTVGAAKTGYTAAADVAKTVTVDLTAPSATYTAPGSLQVGAAITAIQPAGASSDVMSYAAEGLPMGLTIGTEAGEISGTPTTAASATATATVTVTDTAGNAAPVTITFPAVAKGDQTLTGFAYSGDTVVFGQVPPTVMEPTGVQTTLSYAAEPAEVCSVNGTTGVLTPVDVGTCTITVTAAVSADYNEATATFTVMVESAGVLALNVSAVAGNNVVNIAEKAMGFTVSGDAGNQSAATVTVKLGSGTLTATSGSGGSWSATVPPGASYLTGTSVGLTVGVTKTGYSPAADVTRMIGVDLTAPSVSYTAPASLQVDVAASVSPVTADTDLASYAATGLPAGLTIDTVTGAISGTPTAAGAGVTARVTVTDNAGNPTQVSVALPTVDKGGQTLTDFEYSAGSTAFNQTPPTVTAPAGVKTTLSYSAAPAAAAVCTVNAGSGALSFVGLGNCEITATAAGTANYNAATATFTVMVESAGVLALNVSAVATDNVVNIAEKATGFSVAGNTGSQDGVAVALEFGSGALAATSGADGTWSATVAANAGYLTEPGVVLTVGAMKTGYTAAADVVRTVTVDLTAPSVSYTPPVSLQVDVEVSAVNPETADTDLVSYTATGLPAGLTIDAATGVISGTPTTAGAAATVTVTVTDDAGNPTIVSVSLPEVLKGDQPLTGFAYSAAAVVYGNPVPTVIPPTGVKTTLSYAATPPEVCTVTAGDGALSLTEVGECVITVTAEGTANYNEISATFTVNVQPAGSLVLNVPAVAEDDVVNIAEKAAGFELGGDTGADDGATVSVSLGSGSLSATSSGGGAWSVAVPAAAAYLAEPGVALTVTARKTGLTPPVGRGADGGGWTWRRRR